MRMNEILKEKNITKYRLAKESGVPYTTVNDICNGRADISKCSIETIYRISKVLRISMEELVEPYLDHRVDFEVFKSNTCHRVKEKGDLQFIIEVLEKDEISNFYKKQWYRECFYMLAMLDYLSRENDVPLCTQYDELRTKKLRDKLYPSSILMAAKVTKNDKIIQQALKEAIPEFLRFNIVESEVRNVI